MAYHLLGLFLQASCMFRYILEMWEQFSFAARELLKLLVVLTFKFAGAMFLKEILKFPFGFWPTYWWVSLTWSVPTHTLDFIAKSSDEIPFFPPVAGLGDTWCWQFEVLIHCLCLVSFCDRGIWKHQQGLRCIWSLYLLWIEICVPLLWSVWQIVVYLEWVISCILTVCTERREQISLLIPSPPFLGLHNRILTCGARI